MKYLIVEQFTNEATMEVATYEITVYVAPGGKPEILSSIPLLQ